MLAVKAGMLIDGTGHAWPDAIVVVEGERIARLGKAGEVDVPAGTQVIDAGQMTLMPGMIDAHVHTMGSGDPKERGNHVFQTLGVLALNSYVNARKNLEAGVTAIRDASSFGYVDVSLRDAIKEGWLEGPRMVVSGQGITSTGGHMDRSRRMAPYITIDGATNVADSPDEARKAVRYQIKMGADWIKINATLSERVPEMTFETMRAICETAHWAGRKVGAHCHGGQGVTDAIMAGVDCLEHGRFLSDEQMQMMVERGMYLVPTLSPEARMMEMDPKELGYDERSIAWMTNANSIMYNTVARAHRIGVKVAAGSDATMPGVYHGNAAYEMALLVRAGMSPMEGILAGTKIAAEVLDMAKEIGTLEAGKYADLLVVDGNPLADITVLQHLECIKKVIKGGKVVVERP